MATVLPLLERYSAERLPGERFGDFHHRVGVVPAGAPAKLSLSGAGR